MMTEQQDTITPNMVKRDEFGATQVQASGGTADMAVAKAMEAQINARYIMAMRRPRSWQQVRHILLRECQRTGFAEVAMYSKPVGGDKPIEGLSIRFAEAAVRAMTNLHPETVTLYDDRSKRLIRVTVTDLETNICYSQDLMLEKTVERRKKRVRPGTEVLGSRINSYGDECLLVRATEAEFYNVESTAISKAMRNQVLRLLPGDIKEEAMATIRQTLENADKQDPQLAVKKVADGFARINIEPLALESYLGHPLAQTTPAELFTLRTLFAALRDGEISWQDVMQDVEDDRGEEGGGKVQAVLAKLRNKAPAPAVAAPVPQDVPAAAAPPPDPQPAPAAEEAVPDDEDFTRRAERIVASKKGKA